MFDLIQFIYRLTAFVLRSFVQAQSFVYIDTDKITESELWLVTKQQSNGCFEQSGKLFNKRMQVSLSHTKKLVTRFPAILEFEFLPMFPLFRVVYLVR